MSAYFWSSSSNLIIHKSSLWISHTKWVSIFVHSRRVPSLSPPTPMHSKLAMLKTSWMPNTAKWIKWALFTGSFIFDFTPLTRVLLTSQILDSLVCVLGIGGIKVLFSSQLERSGQNTQDKAILYNCLHRRSVCFWVRDCLCWWSHIIPTVLILSTLELEAECGTLVDLGD